MAWRDALARSLGREVEPKTNLIPPMDRMDNMDTIQTPVDSVHSVHFVPRPSTLENREAQAASLPPGLLPHGGPVRSLTPAQCLQVRSWPVETQRLFVTALDAYEAQGHALPVAEALAYLTMQTKAEKGT